MKTMHIEAYGVRGMQSRPWRRSFCSFESLWAWVERNDAEVLGYSEVE